MPFGDSPFCPTTDYDDRYPGQLTKSQAYWQAAKETPSYALLYLGLYAAIRISVATLIGEPITNAVRTLLKQPLIFEFIMLTISLPFLNGKFNDDILSHSLDRSKANTSTHKIFSLVGVIVAIVEFIDALVNHRNLLNPASSFVAVLTAAKSNHELWAYIIHHYTPDVEAVPDEEFANGQLAAPTVNAMHAADTGTTAMATAIVAQSGGRYSPQEEDVDAGNGNTPVAIAVAPAA